MQNLFSIILKMSVSAVPVILFVLCLRQLLKKYPKSYSFALWLMVFASLAVPFKIPVSVEIPIEKAASEFTQTIVQEFSAETHHNNIIANSIIPETEKIQQNITAATTENAAEHTSAETAPAPQAETARFFTLQLWHIWLCGILVLMAFEIVNIKGIYDKTRFAFKKQGNIYLCDEINKPFVFGIIKPKIFLPSDISPQDEQFVTQHEQTHIDRRDYITKPLCFAIAAVHWFNPFVWLSFYLLEKDMELSCDEKVVKNLDTAGIQQYCTALLAFAVKDKPYKINAVLFGEGNCTMRIKNILNFRQPKRITVILLSICVLLAGCTAFATGETAAENTENEINTAALYVEHLDADITKTITDINDITLISNILALQIWQDGTADCLSEFEITFNGDKYYYHSDCGTINDNKNNRSITLDESLKAELDSIIGDMWPLDNQSETEENITETETVDQWTGFPEVIYLPMLEAGKYVFPVDMANENIRISRGYSGQYPSHDGIDIAGPYGTEIFASADGKVIKAEESTVGDGKHIVIEHANGYYTLYGHCSELLVKAGDEVKQGDVIAKMGSTGNSTGNHVHFEFGFGYDSEPNGGLSLDPYNAVGTRCAEDVKEPSTESTSHRYPQQFEAEKLTECLVHSMDKTAFEQNRADFSHRELLIRLSCVGNEDFRYTPMLPLNSNYNKEFGVSVCESIIYDILGEKTDVHSIFDSNTYNAEKDLYEFSTDFGSGSKYSGKNFEYTVEDSGLNCSVSFDLYEERAVNGDPALVNIGRCRFYYKLLTDKNCWQFAGFEKL